MFTGLVEGVGVVEAAERVPGGLRVVFVCPWSDLVLGESVAVDGVCLTVEHVGPAAFAATVGPETLAVTTLADLRPGRRVHLERALRASDRLGGHVVLGHVDGVAEVVSVDARDDGLGAWFRVPPSLARFVAAKGCVALDGVSLTVNEVDGDRFRVDLIPHTLAVTHCGAWQVGTRVNVEVDVFARYVERLVAGRA